MDRVDMANRQYDRDMDEGEEDLRDAEAMVDEWITERDYDDFVRWLSYNKDRMYRIVIPLSLGEYVDARGELDNAMLDAAFSLVGRERSFHGK